VRSLPEVADDFKRVEGKRAQYLKTKITAPGETLGPHAVRLLKGAVPEYI